MKNCKKLLFIIMTVLFVTLCFTFSTSALNATGQCGKKVYWNYDKSTKELVISGSGEMNDHSWGSPFSGSNIKSIIVKNGVTNISPYTFCFSSNLEKLSLPGSIVSIGESAFQNCDNLKTLVIPYGVKNIESSAFSSCDSLETIVLSNSVTSIKHMAFSHCDSIANITIPDSVTEIGPMAFYSCGGLESVTLNNGVKNIGYGAFGWCDNLRSINIPKTVENIGENVFEKCYALENLTVDKNNSKIVWDNDALIDVDDGVLVYFSPISEKRVYTVPDYVTRIGELAFEMCGDLDCVTLGENITSIGSRAFSGCGNLESIHFPAKLEKLDEEIFFSCNFTKKITVDKNNKYYTVDEYGVLFNKDMTEIIYSSDVEDVKNYVIPDTVRIIRSCAFYGNMHLASIDISDSVLSIEDFAFYGCENLTEVNMSENVVFVSSTFGECTALYQDESKWEDGVFYLGKVLIKADPEITKLVVKDGTRVIANNALQYCRYLEDISIPDSVVETGYWNFDNNTYYNNSDNWEDGCLYIGNHLIFLCLDKPIKEGTKTLGFGTFCMGNTEPTVVLPNSLRGMGAQAFADNNGLKYLVIPEGITFIPVLAFSYCTVLEKILIPKSVTAILPKAFQSCENLKDIYFTGSKAEWNKIYMSYDNESLSKANIHYNHKHSYKISIPDGYYSDCLSTKERLYTCECGDSYTKTLTKASHTGGTATCRVQAVCTVCKQSYGNLKAHSYSTVSTNATLSKNGKIESKCSTCGYVKNSKAIAKIGSLTLSATKYIHDGKNKTPKVTIKDSEGKVLTKNVDYKLVVASKRAGIGRYTVKVNFMGNYSGSKSLYFYILPGKPATVKSASQGTTSNKLTWSEVPGAVGYTLYYYSNSKKAYVKINTTTNTTYTVKGLLTGTKYTFKIVAYGTTAAGKVYDSETYALLKSATKTKTPELTKVTASSAKGKAYVYHTNVSGETGYTVYYSTKKDSGFKKYANFKADTTRCDITKLTSGKTYYFKVRTYIKTDSGYVYSAWSAVKSVKVK